jgi:hypothetical protein
MLLVACDAGQLAANGQLAATVREDLAPHRDLVAVAGTTMSAFGPVRLHVGALDLLSGELASAAEHLRAALASCERDGAAIWAAMARTYLGEALMRAGDLGEGPALLERGRDDAARLGLTVVADRAATTAAARSGTVTRPHRG